jgi:hypothetical protein
LGHFNGELGKCEFREAICFKTNLKIPKFRTRRLVFRRVFAYCMVYIRVERSKKICRISKTAGSKTIDIGPKRKRVNFENNRTTFDPRTGPLKIAIFGPKTLFLCKPLLRDFKHQWRPPFCEKKPLTLLVFMKKCFLPIENRSTGSPGPLK